ncbi:interleukin-21 [Corapipo altera]|uniref:interleukin-21 n=1 Tax=Corapipo altera TaxID=415028 RepID=UPI000FD6A49B|nr:interleukin-21 [Corapipo altera]
MERTIIFCMFFFFSSTVLAAASHRAVKYKQILLVIEKLEHAVKDKDVEWLHTPENPVEGCMDTALSCFKNGTLQLQPLNSQVNTTFTKAIRVFRKYTIRSPGKVGFPHSAQNGDHCSLFSIADTTCKGRIVESKLQCESSCESYKKKPPKEFLTSFAKLIQKLMFINTTLLGSVSTVTAGNSVHFKYALIHTILWLRANFDLSELRKAEGVIQCAI